MMDVEDRPRLWIAGRVFLLRRGLDQMKFVGINRVVIDPLNFPMAEVLIEAVDAAFKSIFVFVAGDLLLADIDRINQSFFFELCSQGGEGHAARVDRFDAAFKIKILELGEFVFRCGLRGRLS